MRAGTVSRGEALRGARRGIRGRGRSRHPVVEGAQSPAGRVVEGLLLHGKAHHTSGGEGAKFSRPGPPVDPWRGGLAAFFSRRRRAARGPTTPRPGVPRGGAFTRRPGECVTTRID